MNRIIILLMVLVSGIVTLSAADDYNARKAREYQREAEYYQKKADGYRREADYYLKQAESYQREAAYYTKKGDSWRTKNYLRQADNAMDKYETQMRYAKQADEKAADYLNRASRLLR